MLHSHTTNKPSFSESWKQTLAARKHICCWDGESSSSSSTEIQTSLCYTIILQSLCWGLPTEVRPITRTIWARPSITEESGGKEILYPWKMSRDLSKQPLPSEPLRLHDESPHAHSSKPPPVDFIAQTSPPSAFAPLRKAKKHTSEEFEINSVGTLVSKSSGNQIEGNGKASTRKHRWWWESFQPYNFPGEREMWYNWLEC